MIIKKGQKQIREIKIHVSSFVNQSSFLFKVRKCVKSVPHCGIHSVENQEFLFHRKRYFVQSTLQQLLQYRLYFHEDEIIAKSVRENFRNFHIVSSRHYHCENYVYGPVGWTRVQNVFKLGQNFSFFNYFLGQDLSIFHSNSNDTYYLLFYSIKIGMYLLQRNESKITLKKVSKKFSKKFYHFQY